MTIYRDNFLEWTKDGLVMYAATGMDHDVFLMFNNTPFGPQPTACVLVSTRNPILGEPPLTVANILDIHATKQEVLDAVKGMVEHLNKQRAELMADPPVNLRS